MKYGGEIVGTFFEKELKRQIKNNSELKKYSGEKKISHMPHRKAMIVLSIVQLIKKISLYKMSYFG